MTQAVPKPSTPQAQQPFIYQKQRTTLGAKADFNIWF